MLLTTFNYHFNFLQDVYCVVCHSSIGEHRHREGKCILALVVCLSSWKLYTRGDGSSMLLVS